MIPVDQLRSPAVRALVTAINANDRDAFRTALTPDATMSDDGSERDLGEWTEREIFSSNGHLDVRSQSDDGLEVEADYRNDTWGQMRTSWRFAVAGSKISRIETGSDLGQRT